MSSIRTLLVATALASAIPFDDALAADLPGMKFEPYMRPTKSSTASNRASCYVARSRDFGLRDDSGKIVPVSTSCVWTLERAQGDLVLLWLRSHGLRGWAPASSVVRLDQAAAHFTGMIQTDPTDTFALVMRSTVRFEYDDIDGAVSDVDAALRLKPDDVPALLQRAYLWEWRNRLDLARADVDRVIAVDSRNVSAYTSRGAYEFIMHDYSNATRDFDEATRRGSRSPTIPLCLGMIHIEQNQPEAAIAAFKRAVELDPNRSEAYTGIGAAYMLKGDVRKAIAAVDKAIKVNPRCADAHDMRAGLLFFARGRYDEALREINEAIRLEPRCDRYYRARAVIEDSIEDYTHALADVDQAIRLDPKNAKSHHGRAWILATCTSAAVRDAAQAVASATRACELTSWKDADELKLLALAHSEAGDFQNAVKRQQEAIDLLPAASSDRGEFTMLLDRYKAGKPYHRLGLLQELGLRKYQPASSGS